MRFAFLVLTLVFAGCHNDPQPMHPKPGELPPLPPASGTPVGYLIDAATDLKLRDDQLKQLHQIDDSLAAQDADLDIQIRQIEKPTEEEQPSPQEMKAGKRAARHNNAPGASVQGSANSAKLHDLRKLNDREAVKKAWGVLDAEQQVSAKKILEDRGIEVPGAPKKASSASSEDGTPVPGLDDPRGEP
jgi:hypothetical protein